jgi:hypothetical protein
MIDPSSGNPGDPLTDPAPSAGIVNSTPGGVVSTGGSGSLRPHARITITAVIIATLGTDGFFMSGMPNSALIFPGIRRIGEGKPVS